MLSSLLLSFCFTYCCLGIETKNLRVVNQWGELTFAFPSKAAEQAAIQNGFYVRGVSTPIDVDVHYRWGTKNPRIFVTNPRFNKGQPITLGTVDGQGRIAGYPDYSWHDKQGSNCDGLTSVFRTTIDECNRLWVLDTGMIGDDRFCTPQLLAFDLSNDQLVYRHRFSNNAVTSDSLLITTAVDTRGCDARAYSKVFVYVADVTEFAIVVVDVERDRDWRITHPLFAAVEKYANFTVNGETFYLPDGLLGMALSPYYPGDRDRTLYFHALAAITEGVVKTSLLRDDSFIGNPAADPQSITAFRNKRPNQSAAEAMDRDGILYFGLMEPPSIWCWHSITEFSQRNFHPVAVNRTTLQFASGVKIINNHLGEQELWVLTDSIQKVMTGTINPNEINFRIHTEKLSILMRDSPCKCNTGKGNPKGNHY